MDYTITLSTELDKVLAALVADINRNREPDAPTKTVTDLLMQWVKTPLQVAKRAGQEGDWATRRRKIEALPPDALVRVDAEIDKG